MNPTQPQYWKPSYPLYHTLEGWEFEKQRAKEIIKFRLALTKLSDMVDKYIKKAQEDKTINSFDLHLMHNRAAILHSKVAERLIFDYKESI